MALPSMANSSSLATNPLFDQRAEPAVLYLISKSWLINCVVLLSMMLQVMLACGGTFRHCSSNVILQLILWLGYMSSDAVAIYALGNMAEQSLPGLFGIFAALLLLHLGGPDTITAYSTADNELWTRHMLIMMFQTSVAMYVVYISGLKERLLVAAILLLFVGATKYAERTFALRCASFSEIVSSAKPMYKYMSCGYGTSCQYMVMGVTQWEKGFEGTGWSKTKQVKINDVWKEEGEKATDNYMLCLSHALFKMYKRRYGNLYLHERGEPNTRKFFLGDEFPHLTSDKVFAVLEMELKFLYDALFTKSSGTAYSKLGVVMRLVNVFILGIAGYVILNELGKKHDLFDEALSAQRTVAYIVVCVALIVEFSQLLRIIASDWTLVWLICTNILCAHDDFTHGENSQRIQCSTAKLMKFAIGVLSKVRKWRRRRYWKRAIYQYCVIDTCSQISPLIWKWSAYFHARELTVRCYIRWYIQAAPVGDDLKIFILEQVKDRCSPEEDIEACREKLRSFMSSLEHDLSWASKRDQEHLILHWHVATTICQMEHSKCCNPNTKENETGGKYLCISRSLSRYCAYLLVSCPKLLPLHPDIAKMEFMNLHTELIDFYLNNEGDLKSLRMCSTLGDGAKLARQLLEKTEERRWEIIARHWAEVLIYYAVFGKSTLHAEYLTVGGEFLTQLWVLIGHTGCGDQI